MAALGTVHEDHIRGIYATNPIADIVSNWTDLAKLKATSLVANTTQSGAVMYFLFLNHFYSGAVVAIRITSSTVLPVRCAINAILVKPKEH